MLWHLVPTPIELFFFILCLLLLSSWLCRSSLASFPSHWLVSNQPSSHRNVIILYWTPTTERKGAKQRCCCVHVCACTHGKELWAFEHDPIVHTMMPVGFHHYVFILRPKRASDIFHIRYLREWGQRSTLGSLPWEMWDPYSKGYASNCIALSFNEHLY